MTAEIHPQRRHAADASADLRDTRIQKGLTASGKTFFAAAVRNGRTHRYGDRARTRTVRAGCNERLRSGTYNAEWRSSGGTIPSRIVEVPAARAATKTKKDLQEMQAFDYSWTQRGMIPRPSDYESAALTD
jgi:hypothetical protein